MPESFCTFYIYPLNYNTHGLPTCFKCKNFGITVTKRIFNTFIFLSTLCRVKKFISDIHVPANIFYMFAEILQFRI